MLKFKLEYHNLENIKTASVRTVVFNLHQIKRLNFFLGQLVLTNISQNIEQTWQHMRSPSPSSTFYSFSGFGYVNSKTLKV